jgi:predicted PurR-regulated permease PerM
VKTTGDLLQRHRALRLLVSLLVVIAAIYAASLIWSALMLFSDVILLFFLAWMIAFILEPASLYLQEHRVPRALAVTLIYLALLVVIFSAVVLTVPIIAQQVLLLTGELAHAASPSNLGELNTTIIVLLEHFGLSPTDARSVASQFSSQIPIWVGNFEQQAIGAATGLVTSVLGILFNVVLITIISFYMMLDGDRWVETFVVRLPPKWIPDVRLFQRNVERIFGGFFRAQLIIGALYGVLTWLMLLLLGAPNGLLVAFLSGALMLLPFIGPFLAVIPPVFLLMLESPPNQVAVKIVVLLFMLVLTQQFVMQFLAPRIFGDSMGVHPLLLFAALLVGVKLGGAWGAFFAAPIAALVCATLDVFYTRFTQVSSIFQPPEEEESASELPAETPVSEVVIPDAGSSSHRLRSPLGPLNASYPSVARSEPQGRSPGSVHSPSPATSQHPRGYDAATESRPPAESSRLPPSTS